MPTSRFTDFTEVQIAIFIFQCLVSIFGTGSLYDFKFKVLRVLFQLESSHSEHRNSSYVQTTRTTLGLTDAGNGLAHSLTWGEFLGYLESEFGDTYKIGLVLLEVYFIWPLESLKSDKK